MKHPAIEAFEKKQMKTETPEIRVGDQVRVGSVIVEGKKKRTQKFEGTVVKLRGHLSRRSMTLRKVMDGIGVEKTFLLHSPLVAEVELVKKGKARRARLYYLRERVGVKAGRMKDRE
jgi:large subunit ribosomal protein L19